MAGIPTPGIQDIQGLAKWFTKNLPVLVFIIAFGFYFQFQSIRHHQGLEFHDGMPPYVRIQVEIAVLQMRRITLLSEINVMELSVIHNADEYAEVTRMMLAEKKSELARIEDRLTALRAL